MITVIASGNEIKMEDCEKYPNVIKFPEASTAPNDRIKWAKELINTYKIRSTGITIYTYCSDIVESLAFASEEANLEDQVRWIVDGDVVPLYKVYESLNNILEDLEDWYFEISKRR